MTQVPENPDWLAWIGPIAAATGVVWAFLRRFFMTVTREELRQTLQDIQAERLRLHGENVARFEELFERLASVEQSQARMEGQLSGRYPTLPGKGR